MRRWWLPAVVLVALNMRPAIVSVPPVIDQIRAQFGLSATAAGALTALPVVCMGAFAPLASRATARWGTGPVLAAALALLAVATALRPLGGVALLFAGTLGVGIGVAVGGALLPALVRARLGAERLGPATGVYTAALIGGALLAAAGTEPLRAALGGSWRAALALWAVPAILALAVWTAAADRDRGGSQARTEWSPWRSRTAWLVTVYMGGQSLLFYAPLAWLAARYTDLGWSARDAGLLLGLFTVVQLPSALFVPRLARDGLGPWVGAATSASVLALGLIAVAPRAGAAWAVLLGVGAGANFALALTLVARVAPTPADTPRASGMAFLVGYLLASVGPVAVGALRDATGGFRWPFLVLVGIGVATTAAGVSAAAAVARATDRTPGTRRP